MNLLVNVLERRLRNRKCSFKRHIRDAALIMSGVLLIGVISLGISEFDMTGQSVVYAVNHVSASEESRLQAGLMGVVNGVASMEEYSRAGRLKDVASANEEILVGTNKVNRNAVNRYAFSDGIQKAGELGYDALQAVEKNQMPLEEYETLLQVVEAEATGGDVLSKLLVANVVLNRVKDSHFPDTIYDVVWQSVEGSAQFSPTEDGRISSCAITDSTMEAVERALAGEDNSQGALFFIARNSAASRNVEWFDTSLVKLLEYGGHEYYTFKEYCE
ncbi:MAG: cell wall hydrolase [Lachnospiraceae bacterium]|nr:cell wall hydrolase [Lachnospiraceae bacterium]MDD3795982.1 cell wall hydrolase [Lachnospiraceae bacterium]